MLLRKNTGVFVDWTASLVIEVSVASLLNLGLTVKYAPRLYKYITKTKNGNAISQNLSVQAAEGTAPVIASGGRDAFAAGRDQYVNCSLKPPLNSTEQETAAATIKHAIRIFFSAVLGNLNKGGVRENGLLDHRNLASGKLKPSMLFTTLNAFRHHRKKLQEARKSNASRLEEEDQFALRILFNSLVGESEINSVTEEDVHAVTETQEKDFISESDKILNRYLK